jgi:UDP-galactopyranose mutase
MPQVTLESAVDGPSHLNEKRPYDYLIVGAGFAGAVIAERLAEGLGQHVLLIDRREHIGGNAYDHLDAAGIMVHRYGPHIFHTNAQRIVDYLSRFTQWRPYQHRVLARVDEQLLPIPINLTTLNGLFGLSMNEQESEQFLAERAEPVANIRTSEDVVINQIGRGLYEKFFRGYTRKQWGLDPSELDRSVTSRIPTRTNEDDRYFTDTFQMMPLQGYTQMFERMLDHPGIDLLLGADFAQVRERVSYRQLIYCGPVDEYFDFCFGRLPYRSLRFQHETLPQGQFQSVAVVNYPDQSVPYTRITEYKHLTGQAHPLTSISYEFPCADGDPYYPIPRPENAELYKRYSELAEQTPGVTFLGRLGTYKYYNMDQVVGQALALYQRIAQQAGIATSSPAVEAG